MDEKFGKEFEKVAVFWDLEPQNQVRVLEKSLKDADEHGYLLLKDFCPIQDPIKEIEKLDEEVRQERFDQLISFMLESQIGARFYVSYLMKALPGLLGPDCPYDIEILRTFFKDPSED